MKIRVHDWLKFEFSPVHSRSRVMPFLQFLLAQDLLSRICLCLKSRVFSWCFTFFSACHPQKGTKAPQAAGKIHTDFEKGFIMAEVMKFDDFKELGSEAAVKVKISF